MVTSLLEGKILVWYVLWSVALAWPMGDVQSVAHAADPAARNEMVSTAGSVVVGRVSYRGSVPTPSEIPVDRDSEVCGRVVTVPTLSVDTATHGVREAIVHVDSEQGMKANGSGQISVVQNRRCVFSPRVAALRVGAETEIRNDDPVMHNTNISLQNSTVLNVALVPGGNPIKKPLKNKGCTWSGAMCTSSCKPIGMSSTIHCLIRPTTWGNFASRGCRLGGILFRCGMKPWGSCTRKSMSLPAEPSPSSWNSNRALMIELTPPDAIPSERSG